ncbi:G-protein coupled receptor moody-like [Aricia agestis]|uniref:G-protein coupled receptor moody-like n=1 Tax=Aricia agestis TaxID=91739 RepID=UPI001C20673D|nr:G-protein coupled receptor moody-like [Aricia agestis]
MAGLNDSVNVTDDLDVELFQGYPPGLLEYATASCIILMFIGIPGNLVTIIALANYRKVRNATAIFIMNLSLSDLLFCCFILPLSASTFSHRSWIHGSILCYMFPFARYALVAVSLLTICAITINRYIIIAHPRLYPKLYTSRNIGIMIAIIWIFSFGMLATTCFAKWGRFGLDTRIGSCSILPDDKNRSPKKILFLTAFSITCTAIVVCYTRIFFIVRKTTKNTLRTERKVPNDDTSTSSEISTSALVKLNIPEASTTVTEVASTRSSASPGLQRTVTIKVERRDGKRVENKSDPSELRRTALRRSMAMLKMSLPTRKDRRLGTLILAIMISFCVCHLPITVTKLLREGKPSPGLNIASYILIFLSSSINPIIYVVMSNEYRKAYKHLLKLRRRKEKFSLNA